MNKLALSEKDREFFSLVSKAAFINPFSKQRFELDQKIIGDDRPRPWRLVVPDVIREVGRRIVSLDEGGKAAVGDFEPGDQKIIRDLFLFDVFHRYKDRFDEHIIGQSQNPDEILAVEFADKAIGELRNRGFSGELAVRSFSMFYQIRRAFHFIDRGLIGQSDAMRQLRCNLWNNIFTHDIAFYEQYLWDKMEDFSTLLLGPTGSGKGAAAAAIGRSGFIPYDVRKGRFAENFMASFIPINLSQYPETLIESELFGHSKGAFTGAVAAHDGLFALCGSHGTVFLDEIGDVSEQVQIKLLRVLQERVFSPVGSHQNRKFHGRVVAATNKSLDDLRAEGSFRDDFYYRLCSDTIIVPSLRERLEDDPGELDELIEHTVGRTVGRQSSLLAAAVREVVDSRLGKDYPWPGNVRELEQCLRRVIIKRDYAPQRTNAKSEADIFAAEPTAAELLSRYCVHLYDKYGSLEKAARITNLDRRTVKKHIDTSHSDAGHL